mgnify:CR=1 FL=1
MRPQDVQKAKQSVMKVMGVHTGFNWSQPNIVEEEFQAGGTAFFINPNDLGAPFVKPGNRYLVTNFHVVDSIQSKTVELCYPSKGFNRLTAKIIHVVPSLDVAILTIDPDGPHVAWRDENIQDFLDNIPNLKLNTECVKGNSQNVIAIGFPSLSRDVQLCGGRISGRGLGMIQINISLNGGNSGGPLMHNHKVIGICTASEADTEAIGLCVPIHQIIRFFKYWASYKTPLMKLPSWGLHTEILTEDYLKYHKMDQMNGVLVDKVIPKQAADKAGLTQKDIIIKIINKNGTYDVDSDGLVKVEWTEKRVHITNNEFIMSLDPGTIEFEVYKRKRIVTVPINPDIITFQTREKYHCWEDVPYVTFGGAVFMDLTLNHLEEDEEDEMCIPHDKCYPITNAINENMNMKSIVVCTHIPGQTYLDTQRSMHPFDIIQKVNNSKVKDVLHFRKLIEKCSKKNKHFVTLETHRNTIYIDLKKIVQQERKLAMKLDDQVFLQSRKRKRIR